MRYARLALVLVVAILPVLASADDQKKADKQLNRITAMAGDLTGRRVVNFSMSEHFKVSSADLVRERRENDLNYGAMFVVQSLVKSGTKMSDIADQLRAGKSLTDIANANHADWKQIADDAKKFNKEVEDNLYDYFLNDRALKGSDSSFVYDPAYDGVKADLNVSKDDLAQAQDTYVFWRDRATSKKDSTLNHSNEQAARQAKGDPVRNGGPQSDQVGNSSRPQ
jgi:hypothetical protein